MPERRQENRNTCYLRAEIIVNHHTDPVPAEAHDISEYGLRLVVPDTSSLPDEFIVSIPRRKIRETVQVVRRSAQELGVMIRTSASIA